MVHHRRQQQKRHVQLYASMRCLQLSVVIHMPVVIKPKVRHRLVHVARPHVGGSSAAAPLGALHCIELYVHG